MSNYPNNISSRQWAGEIEAGEVSALRCEEFCQIDHERDVWLREADQWYYTDCLVDHFVEEFYALFMDLVGWDGDQDEQEVMNAFTITTMGDKEDEFTHFQIISHCNAVGNFEITLAMLEKEKIRQAQK